MAIISLSADRRNNRVVLAVGGGRKTRVSLTEEQLQHLANRFASWSRAQHEYEELL